MTNISLKNADKKWMSFAISEAQKAVGRAAENPPVGCVIIATSGHIVGVGHTARTGRPHAETVALAMAGDQAHGGTAYVTLEPCAHHGQTPPCATALIKAGIKRVVISWQDPDKRVNGKGVAMLRNAGIEVVTDIAKDVAFTVMQGFLHRMTHKRPLVTMKTATSLDGGIALGDGRKVWLTAPPMRRYVHLLRSKSDAILTGIGTILADDPEMTCRLPGLEADSPSRFILDSQLRCPPDAKILQNSDDVQTVIFCAETASSEARRALERTGAKIVPIALDAVQKDVSHNRLDLSAVLRFLGDAGINNLLVEAGSNIVTSIITNDFVDFIHWTQSPHLLGSDAIPAISPLKLVALPEQTRYTETHHQQIGRDRLTILAKSC
ncbi:MAG: bifunctional diaminohydroxyphosphoribosylaminopyrimidine deaminase/5-amino-6-(5-phosphoribosylamino)uracil reductase RibD [Candidatus Puniceispirillum sp.]|uniref:bifunctional diaminohydroxyphosphoribosylaminopyrimidine deaminase/5-amino-6-(5-phosphoribosylamino)uracil reductase RibD n=1 Tax=uncultured Candidatus Puniceispirillum sp. TaxID=1985115 RepID=UPI002A6C729F|nr:bifunctional diaminohydroxyphosphoribosylaminopyrimidine deaminase/5-amino-6-(5-phosphoribosylamino)uracil reductase RibD [Candidatus Puniceispirillum sp.]MBT6565260.1 bifunctional diaminohydroxyphosphoribosylaminopyrimidine deaminase/5-amino-6-(5-phosphoribosylamino)uracil reductase RibD [Candidatus Puniceispirillum sp.]